MLPVACRTVVPAQMMATMALRDARYDGDGQDGALGDGTGRVLEVARHVGPRQDPDPGREVDGEDGEEVLHLAAVEDVARIPRRYSKQLA